MPEDGGERKGELPCRATNDRRGKRHRLVSREPIDVMPGRMLRQRRISRRLGALHDARPARADGTFRSAQRLWPS